MAGADRADIEFMFGGGIPRFAQQPGTGQQRLAILTEVAQLHPLAKGAVPLGQIVDGLQAGVVDNPRVHKIDDHPVGIAMRFELG